MIKITNIGGLISLLFLWYNYPNWSININETNIISSKIVTFLSYMPIKLVFIIAFVLYIRVIIKNKGNLRYLMYFFSIILFRVLCKISISTLMLEDTTTFLLFKIDNPVPLELKIYFLQNLLVDIMKTYPYNIPQIENLLNNPFDLERIRTLNASQLVLYTNDLCNIQDINNNKLQSNRLFILGVFCYIFISFINY